MSSTILPDNELPASRDGSLPLSGGGVAVRAHGGRESGGAEPPPDVFSVLWKQRSVFAPLFMLSVLAGALYLALATPLYTATARVEIVPTTPRPGAEAPNAQRIENYINTQCQLISSWTVLSRVIDRPEFGELKAFAGAEDPMSSLRKRLVVTPGRRDNLVTVAIEAEEPAEAEWLVDAVVNSYLEHVAAQGKATTSELLRFIEQERNLRSAELLARRKSMLTFKRDKGTLSFMNERGNISLERLGQLTAALTDAQIAALQASAAYEAGHAIMNNPANEGYLAESLLALAPGPNPEDEALANMREELWRAQVHMESRSRQLGANNRNLLHDQKVVADLERKLLDMDRAAAQVRLEVLRQSWEQALAKQEAVQVALDQERQRALELDSAAGEFAVLQSDVEQAQRIIDDLDRRVSELRLSGEAGALGAGIVDPARSGRDPSSPRKAIVLAAAIGLGLILGSGGALVRNLGDRRMRSVGDVMTALRLPLVCGVPHIEGHTIAQRGTVSILSPESEAAEAFRIARTTLDVGQVRRQKTLLVTSSSRGEGKSTVASNLAITLAQGGERTLIMDADLRGGRQHIIFGCDGEVGLSSVLTGRTPVADAIQRTACEGLDLLPRGPLPPNPAEMLGGPVFAALLRELGQWYDRIIVDAPPAVGIADSLILGARCHGTLLVIRLSHSTRARSESTCAALTSVGARLVGVLVNGDRAKGEVYAAEQHYGGRSGALAPRLPGDSQAPSVAALHLADQKDWPLADLLAKQTALFRIPVWTVRADAGAGTGSIRFQLYTPEGALAWEHVGNSTTCFVFGQCPAGPNPPPAGLACGTYQLEVTPYRLPGGPHVPGNVAGRTLQLTLIWRTPLRRSPEDSGVLEVIASTTASVVNE